MQKELKLQQRRWMELLEYCDIELLFHPGKANVVADALSRKSSHLASLIVSDWRSVKDLGPYVLHVEDVSEKGTLCNLSVHSELSMIVIEAHSDDLEATEFRTRFLDGDARAGWMIHADSSLHYHDRLFIPIACRDVILREFHRSPLVVYPRDTKMYHDLRRQFWWSGMKKDAALFVSRCLTCQQVKAKHQ